MNSREITIVLDENTLSFYESIANVTERTVDEILGDTLLKVVEIILRESMEPSE